MTVVVPLALRRPWAAGALGGALLGWLAVEVRAARGPGGSPQTPAGPPRHQRVDQGTRDVVLLGYAAALVLAPAAAVAVPAATLPAPPAAALVAGIGAIGAGLALRTWSIRTLGIWFTYDVQVRAGQPVVDSGPYRVLRHPSYTGALLCAGGFGLALGNAVSVAVALAAPLVGTLRRIRVEEDALRGELGAAYESYCGRTFRLLPGVW